MDLTQLSEEELQQLANIGNFAAMSELASRRSADNTMGDMSAIERENLREAIKRNLVTDTQGDIQTFDIEKDGDDDLMEYSDSELMESDTTSQRNPLLDLLTQGGTKLLDFIGSGGIIGNTLSSLGDVGQMIFNPKESKYYRGVSDQDLAGFGGTLFGKTAEELNRMNALGGYYSDPMREMRSRSNRISNMLQRGAAGKGYSQASLDNLLGQFGFKDIDTQGMMDSIQESSQTGYGGLGSAQAAATAAAMGGRDYSRSPGAMAGDMEYDEE